MFRYKLNLTTMLLYPLPALQTIQRDLLALALLSSTSSFHHAPLIFSFGHQPDQTSTMLVSTAAAASRRGMLVLRGASISSSVPPRAHAIRGLSVIAQPNAYASRCFSSHSTATADDAAAGPADVDAKVQREVLDRCEALHSSLMPLNEKVCEFNL